MEKGSTPLLTSLQPDQAGFRDPKQAVNKKMKKKRTHRPTQVIPARRLQADR